MACRPLPSSEAIHPTLLVGAAPAYKNHSVLICVWYVSDLCSAVSFSMIPLIKFFTEDNSSKLELADRAARLTRRGRPESAPDPVSEAVLFLRGVRSRVTLALPAFYLYLGARSSFEQSCVVEGYPGKVLKHVLDFSSINTVSLCCRKVFDDSVKAPLLTGGRFSKISDANLELVAAYWSENADKPVEDAFQALFFLREVFKSFAKSDTVLFKEASSLGRRIGLIKQHADRNAAHLSLQSYEFSIEDCAHVVAALTVIGEIIRSFDDPDTALTYFDDLDAASLGAARSLFSLLQDDRLFHNLKIGMHSRLSWQWGAKHGHDLLENLPNATGWTKS